MSKIQDKIDLWDSVSDELYNELLLEITRLTKKLGHLNVLTFDHDLYDVIDMPSLLVEVDRHNCTMAYEFLEKIAVSDDSENPVFETSSNYAYVDTSELIAIYGLLNYIYSEINEEVVVKDGRVSIKEV